MPIVRLALRLLTLPVASASGFAEACDDAVCGDIDDEYSAIFVWETERFTQLHKVRHSRAYDTQDVKLGYSHQRVKVCEGTLAMKFHTDPHRRQFVSEIMS